MRTTRGPATGDANRTTRRAGGLAAVGTALAFVALVVVALVVALFTRSWDGLEALVIPPFAFGVFTLGVWVSVLSVVLIRSRRWAMWATLVTFLLAGVATGGALLDTAHRTLVDQTAPVGHLVLPALLFGTAASVVSLVIRNFR